MISTQPDPAGSLADTVTLGAAQGVAAPELAAAATARLLTQGGFAHRRADQAGPAPAIDPTQVLSGLPEQPLTLLLVDVDGFEAVVECHGEAAGEGLMAQILERAQSVIRHSDRTLRWSRREMLVLAGGHGGGNRLGERLADTLRTAVAAREFGPLGKLTISVGVAESLGYETGAVTFQRLAHLLALTRDQGPNRVVVDHRERRATP
jgi:GGDEF domain-containing protein